MRVKKIEASMGRPESMWCPEGWRGLLWATLSLMVLILVGVPTAHGGPLGPGEEGQNAQAEEASETATTADTASAATADQAADAEPGDGAEPEDGKVWLTDEEGKRFYIDKVPKIEGKYRRLGDNRIRTRWGIDIIAVEEDEDFFYFRVYDHSDFKSGLKPTGPSEEEIAAVKKSFEVDVPEKRVLEFRPFRDGLPAQGQWRHGFDVADMNEDGHPDLVHGSPRKPPAAPVIYLGDGQGKWKRWDIRLPRVHYDYGDVAVADFNRDGHMDMALAMHMKGLAVLLGDGEGGFIAHNEGLPLYTAAKGEEIGFTSRALETVDWNRDGLPDLVALGEGPRLERTSKGGLAAGSRGTLVFLNRGEDGWEELDFRPTDRQLTFGDTLTTGDVDGDGSVDFVTASHIQGYREILHLAQQDGGWKGVAVDSMRPVSYTHAAAVGDFNGDDRQDLALSFLTFQLSEWHSGVDVLFATDDGWERKPIAYREERNRARSLATGDVDGDGRLDLAAAWETGEVWIFKGDGDGGFTRLESPGLHGPAGDCRGYHVMLEDLDGDGMDEVLASFAGERSGIFVQTDCPSGGSLEAWDPVQVTGSGGG